MVAHTAAALVALAAAGSVAPIEHGPGAASCAAYVALYDGVVPTREFVSWAQGYLAAVNVAYGQRIDLDSARVGAWLLDYCRKHPQHRFGIAVHALARTHAE